MTQASKMHFKAKRFDHIAEIFLIPAALVAVVLYLGTAIWAFITSFTASKSFPTYDFVGWSQYRRLFSTFRWAISIENVLFYGLLLIGSALIIGLAIALLLEANIRGEAFFRTIFLYPYAMSLVVTGIAWQWLMNPSFGLEPVLRSLGWQNFHFAFLSDPQTAIYGVAIAGIWQCSGFVAMIFLSTLRGVDQNIIRAAKIDGVATWRIYVSLIFPELTPAFATASIFLSIGVLRTYDVVVVMTGGGPGVATEMPAKFIVDNIISRQNLGQATAASSLVLLTVLLILLPLLWLSRRAQSRMKEA